MPNDSSDQIAKLQAELDEITRREAAFRLKTVKDFFHIEAEHRQMKQKFEEQKAYIHQLHLERNALKEKLHEARLDTENLSWKLHETERDASALRSLKQSFAWSFVSGLAKRPRGLQAAVPAADFTYHLYESPYRVYRDKSFTLTGWLVPKDGRAVTGIRIRVDEKTYLGQHGREEPEVIAKLGSQPQNPKPGFSVTFDTPAGRHAWALEAQIENGDWFTVLLIPIWCEPRQASS